KPNQYERGRANIIVYNWDRLDTISVDVKGVLPVGWGFEVRNVQDYYAAPVLTGVFSGQRLQLPMTNLTVAAPGVVTTNGQFVAARSTGPIFNVFVLLPDRPPLQVTNVDDVFQIQWPISSGGAVLESTDS